MLHFHVEYTTPLEGQYYAAWSFAKAGEDTFVVDVPLADHEAATEITMKFFDLSVNDNVFAFFKRATF